MSQEIFKNIAITPVRINPSILEGEMVLPSMLGPKAAIAITRYAPSNISLPYISGESRIPATLSANPGTWDGSPKPTFTYQWFIDGVADVTGNTFETYDAISDTNLSVQVTATSTQGVVTELTSDFFVQSVYPVNIEEAAYYVITGAPIIARSVMVTHRFYVVTGQPTDNELFQASNEVYVVETV